MIERPSLRWRRKTEEQEAAVAAGTLPREKAYAALNWPPSFTAAVDAVFVAYEQDVDGLQDPQDATVWSAVERVVVALNAIDDEEGLIETTIREDLCEYIDVVLEAAGIDVDALVARRGIDRSELTDAWRDW